jgi:hypothetical protein
METKSEITTPVRERIKTYTSCLIIWITTFVLLTAVPLFPGGVILPVLLGVGLSLVYLKEPDVSLIILYLLTYFSIMWELVGFGFFQLLATSVGIVVILALVIPLWSLLSDRIERISITLVILSVSLMLTPLYFLSIPLILVATLFEGFGSARVLFTDFVLLLAPFVILDNAIYFSTSPGSGSSAPIIFSQLSNLVGNLRPPLSGITGIPSNYLYTHALAVTNFLSTRAYVVYIPLLIFGIVLVVSVSVAGLANTLLKKLAIIEIAQKYSAIFTPIAVSVIATAAFIMMILALSPLGADVFQTALSNGVGAYLVIAGSMGIAGSMTATELLTQRLERTQITKIKLQELITTLDGRIRTIEEEIKEISANAPSIDLSSEKKTLAELSSYVSDVKRQLSAGSYGSFHSWISDIENRIFPSLDIMPQMIMTRLISGLHVLSAASLTTNSRLDESKATGPRYPSMGYPVISHLTPVEEILQIYQRALVSIEETTTKLFDFYVESIRAYSALMLVDEIAPPVSPTSLLGSRDYVAAMKLVSEDYWLNFHIRESERYNDKLRPFLAAVSKIEDVSKEENQARLAEIIKICIDTSPSSAPLMIKNLDGVIEFLHGTMERAIEEIETVKKIVSTVDPSFSNVLKLNTSGIFYELLAIQGAMRRVKPNFSDTTALSKEALPILQALSNYRKIDEESLVVISQYPVAVRLLQRLFAENKEVVQTAELPFQRDTAIFFLRSFAASNKSYSYDEEREELSYEHDKMYQRP